MENKMDIKEFWNSVHTRNETLWLTNSNPQNVYKMHSFPTNSSETILEVEVGVGTGGSIQAHAGRKNKVVAVDISPEALNKVSNISRTCLTENMPTALESSFVDRALCHLVFQHCNDDMVKFIITNVLRTLKPTGIFHFQFAELPYSVSDFDESYKFAINNGIMHFRSLAEITKLVEECGGELVYTSEPIVWTTQYNITWYMLQIKRK